MSSFWSRYSKLTVVNSQLSLLQIFTEIFTPSAIIFKTRYTVPVKEYTMNLPDKLQLSSFCHTFRREEEIALFHTLRIQTSFLKITDEDTFLQAIINRDTISVLTLSDDQRLFAEQLLDLGILVSDINKDKQLLEDIREDNLGYPDISILYLLLTDQCNLACKYCFIEGAIPSGYKFSVMEKSTAKAAVDLFSKQIRKCDNPEYKPSVIFYGGEPTVNWKTLESTVLYIRGKIEAGDLPENTEISIITNGTLLGTKRIHFLRDNNVGISISLDGPGMNNDSRIFTGGKKSFDKVMETYNSIKEERIPVSISCTITPQNVDNLKEIAHWLVEIGVISVGFNILMDVPGKPLVDEGLVYRAVDGITESYKLFREHGIYEDRMGRKIDAFTNQRIYPFDCGGYGGQMVIAPDGQIGICHAYLGERKYFTANVCSESDFEPSKDPGFIEWSKRSPLNMEQCYSCPVLGICGGGCAKNAEMRHGTIWGLDDRFCIHAKHTLEWMIWDLFDIVSSAQITSDQKGG